MNGLETHAAEGFPEHMDLGAMRTVMAADRSLMARIRASLSMLSFGFSIMNRLF